MTTCSVNKLNNLSHEINLINGRWHSLSAQESSCRSSVHTGMGANLFDDNCSFRVWAPNSIVDRLSAQHST